MKKKYFIEFEKVLKIGTPYPLGNNEITFFYDNNILKAYSSFCPHFGGPLVYNCDEKKFKCYWHNYSFNKKGECSSHNLNLKVVFFDVEINDGKVFVLENI